MDAELNVSHVDDARGRHWRVRAAWRDALFHDGAFVPDGVPADRVLRRTASRAVTVVTLPGNGARVVVKAYTPRGPVDGLLRGSVFKTAAEIEWHAGLALERAGIAVATPLAVGAGGGGLARVPSWIVTAEVPGARDLASVAADPAIPARVRRQLVNRLADLFRALHGAGILHGDPHPENFLTTGLDADPRVIPIDLRRVRTGARPDRAACARDLARMVPGCAGAVSTAECARFLHRYLGAAASRADVRAMWEAVAARGQAMLASRARRRMKTAIEGDRRTTRVLAGGLSWHVRRDADQAALAAILADPEAALANGAILKTGRSATVASSPPFVVKKFKQKRPVNQLVDRVRLDRARGSFARAALLDYLRIPAARTLAAAARTRHGLVACGYVVTELVPDAHGLLAALKGGASTALLAGVGAYLARLHGAGFSHRDLKESNVLVDASGAPRLIDLCGIRRRPITLARRAADLGRLLRDLHDDPRFAEWRNAVLLGYAREAPARVLAPLQAALRGC